MSLEFSKEIFAAKAMPALAVLPLTGSWSPATVPASSVGGADESSSVDFDLGFEADATQAEAASGESSLDFDLGFDQAAGEDEPKSDSGLDLEDFPKAPREAYFELAEGLEGLTIDAVSLEDAHRHNDLALLERVKRLTVILGVVRIAATPVEEVAEIRDRLSAALAHIDADRLIAGPDCGLAMLPRDLVFAKLVNMCEAARSL